MRVVACLFLTLIMLNSSLGIDFMKRQECVLTTPNRAPVYTKCLITGGMQGGTIDIVAKAPDGRKYAIEGPTDGEDGKRYKLQNAPAHLRSRENKDCYERNDKKLEICLGKEID